MADEKLIFDLLTGQNTIAKDLNSLKTQTISVEKNISSLSTSFSSVGKSVSSLTSVVKAFGTAAVVAVGAFVGSEVVKAAEEQENAINRLNAALKINGNLVGNTSQELIAYAEALQSTTTIADDVTLSNLSLLQSLAPLTKEGLIAANNAAINLSSALRIDLDSAVRLVGKAANGEVDTFKRYGIEIRKGANDAETFSNTLTVLNTKFGGAAANEINTFSGALLQSRNAFGDVLEEIGNLIIQTPEVIDLIKSSAVTFTELAQEIKSAAPAIKSFFGESILLINDFTVSIQNAVDALIKSDFGRTLSASIRTTASAFDIVFGAISSGAVSAAKDIGILSNEVKKVDSGFGQSLSSTDETFNAIIDGTELATKSVKKLNSELLKTGTGGVSDEFRKAIESQIKSLESSLKSAGETQAQIIAKEAGERARLIQNAERLGIITRQNGEALLSKIRLDVVDKVNKAEKDAADQRRKKLQEAVQIAAQNPLSLAFQDVDIELPDGLQSAFAGVFGTLSNITKGAQGASGLLSGFAGAAANAFAPGTGAAAQEVFSLLAQGPAKVKETFDAFFLNLPSALENIIGSIPQLLVSFAENLGPLIDRLAESIPVAVQSFLDRLPEIGVKLSEAMVRAAFAFQARMPFVAAQLGVSFAAEMPKASIAFIDGLIKETPRLISEMIKQIPQAVGGLGGSIGGAAGGLFGTVGNVFSGIGDVFGFADGGIVPGSAPFTDRVPALLTPGEAVIDRSLVNRLESFLGNSQQANSSGSMTVNLVIGEQQLANVILDLNRRGYRLV